MNSTPLSQRRQAKPAGAVAQVCASPVTFTSTEVFQGKRGIRWVSADFGVCGHPTLHDLFDYIVQRGPAIDCNCERCADWKLRFAAGAGAVAPWRASQALAQAADEMRQVRQELELAAAEGESAAAETSRVLKQALDALVLVMDEPVGDGIQVKQRIGAELAYGIDHTIGALRAQIALLADEARDVGGPEATGGRDVDEIIDSLPQQRRDKIDDRAAQMVSPAPDVAPVRDIHLPDGSVRHNVGSDNLSDEDREAMVLTDDQVAALNEDERRNGPYGGAAPVSGLHPQHCTGGEGAPNEGADPSGTPQDSASQPAGDATPESGASGAAAGQSGVMAALIDNVRNAGHKWTFGAPNRKTG